MTREGQLTTQINRGQDQIISWNYADESELPTFQNNIESMTPQGNHQVKAPVKFDIDETGRYILMPKGIQSSDRNVGFYHDHAV